MATPDELRVAIADARQELKQAFVAASDGWERQSAQSEDEEPWTVRQTAEHAVESELVFANEVCTSCGYPGPENPFTQSPLTFIRGHLPEEIQLANARGAEDALEKAVAAADAKMKYVTETDLAMKNEHFGTVGELMERWTRHLQRHAAQIRSAAQG